MKWTYDWLQDYLKTDADAQTISDTLTRIGLEVEDLQSPISPIAAKIVECKAHENSDHLHVLQVDDGTGTLRQVVCGAPNVHVGLRGVLAPVGAKLPGMKKPMAQRTVAGIESFGMMCSASELGQGGDDKNIIELGTDAEIGSEYK